MQHLNAPWREKYFNEKKEECPFCNESKTLIYEGKYSKVIMNKYPYSPGHMLITPFKHVSFINELDLCVWQEMCDLARVAELVLLKELNAQGVNIGLNLGDAAGAGIAEHIHMHALPRWKKDTNFITTIADTRVLGSDLDKLYIKIKNTFKNYL